MFLPCPYTHSHSIFTILAPTLTQDLQRIEIRDDILCPSPCAWIMVAAQYILLKELIAQSLSNTLLVNMHN